MAKRKRRKAMRQGAGLVAETVGLSVGSQAVGAIGGPIAGRGQTGLQTMAGFLPLKGAIFGGAAVLRELKGLKLLKKRKKRKRRR